MFVLEGVDVISSKGRLKGMWLHFMECSSSILSSNLGFVKLFNQYQQFSRIEGLSLYYYYTSWIGIH